MKNTETASNGQEVYLHQIYLIADEYIRENLDGDSGKVADYFRDMILFIADRIPKIDNSDIEALDHLFSAYVRLCKRYKVLPTLECFSLLSKINRATFTDWSNGEYRVSTQHGNTVKKWYSICKSFLIDTLSNTRGTDANRIFIAKAAYGLAETAPIQIDSNDTKRALTASELPKLTATLQGGQELPKLSENQMEGVENDERN